MKKIILYIFILILLCFAIPIIFTTKRFEQVNNRNIENKEKQNIENVVMKAEQYGNIEDKRDNNIGKQYEWLW